MSLADALPGTTPDAFATGLLTLWHAPVNPTNLDTLTRWFSGESSGYNPSIAGGRYNPLNIVAQGRGNLQQGQISPVDGSNGQGGQQGNIADFPTAEAGMKATAALFANNPNAAGILAGLRSSNQPATFGAIQSFYGTWGGKFAPGPSPSEVSTGSAGTGQTGTTGTTTGDTSTTGSGGKACDGSAVDAHADNATILRIVMPGSVPNLCLTRAQGRALLGAACLVGGAGVLLLGAGFVFSATKVGKSALGAAAPIAALAGA